MTAHYAQSREVQRPRGRLRRHVLPLLIALVILIGLLFAVAWIPLSRSRDAWLHGHDATAIAGGEEWSRLHLWPAQYHQLLAAAYLTSGNTAAARGHLGGFGNITFLVIQNAED